MKYCSNCGEMNPVHATSCQSCGENLSAVSRVRAQAYQNMGDGAATGSLVCGILCLFFFGVILGIIAITLGDKARSYGFRGGKATAGTVLGIIGISLWALVFIRWIFYLF